MSDHGLAVDHERLRLDDEGILHDGREAVRPVMTVLGEAANPRAIPAHHQSISIVLDLVNPRWAGRRLGRLRRQARFGVVGRYFGLAGHDFDCGSVGVIVAIAAMARRRLCHDRS